MNLKKKNDVVPIEQKVENNVNIDDIAESKNEKNIGNNKCEFEKLECWNDIIKYIHSNISSSLSFLLKGTNAYISDNSIMIDTNDFVFDMIQKSHNEIERIIFEKTGKNYKICILESKKSICNENQLDIKYLKNKAESSNLDFDIN